MTTANHDTKHSSEDRPANDANPEWVERADELTGDGPPPAQDPMVEHYRDK